MRKERLIKILNILYRILDENEIMNKTPEELEHLLYKLMIVETPVVKPYLEKYYDKKGNKKID